MPVRGDSCAFVGGGEVEDVVDNFRGQEVGWDVEET